MKGIIFQLLGDAVVRTYGDETWDAVIGKAGIGGAYTSLGTYADAEFEALVDATCVVLDRDHHDVVRWLGRSAIPVLAARYPDFFTPHQSTIPFLLTLNDIIHVEVRKLYPEAAVPYFEFTSEAGVIAMRYHSERRMCAFAEGLIEGSADLFGEKATITQPECKLRGDATCLLVTTFERRA